MAVIDIYNAVATTLTANGVVAEQSYGASHRHAHQAPPSYLWIPRGGNGGPVDGTSAGATRRLRTRNVRIDIRCWGTSESNAEALLNALIAAVHRNAVGYYSFDNEDWIEGNGEVTTLGHSIVATFTFKIPVTDFAISTAPVTSVAIAPEFGS